MAFVVVFWIADYAGCEWTKTNDAVTANVSPKDPSLRYVGPLGAVVGYDNYGGETRLQPGTAVRLSGGSYVDPMTGPKKIYVVTEGSLRGMQVPLSESDLEPQ
jgi:hypothetical protein